ncbi:MAG: TIGR04211 family SH3 domain-containing protein [Thiotrichales bacterium]
MTLRLLSFLLVFIAATPIFAAEGDEQQYVYVTDVLRLNLYADPDGKNLIRKLVSGEKLVELETRDNYVKVRTEQGEEGWVKRFYTVTEPPAIAQLPELEARIAAQEEEIRKLKQNQGKQPQGMSAALKEDYEDKLIKLNEENVQLLNQLEKQRKELQQLQLKALHDQDSGKSENRDSVFPFLPANFTQSAIIALIAAAAGILLGIILGYRIYANRLKKRFYGFRV